VDLARHNQTKWLSIYKHVYTAFIYVSGLSRTKVLMKLLLFSLQTWRNSSIRLHTHRRWSWRGRRRCDVTRLQECLPLAYTGYGTAYPWKPTLT
jgi:hypothetical protein